MPSSGMMQLHAVSTQQPNIDIPFPFSSITCFISPGEFSSLELYATNGGGTAGASFGRSVAPWGRSLTYGGGFGPVFGSFPLGKASVEASWRTLLARSRWNISASRSRDGSLRRFMGPLVPFLPCEWSKEAVFQGLLRRDRLEMDGNDFRFCKFLVQIPKIQLSFRGTGSQDCSNGNVFKRHKVKAQPREPHQHPPWSKAEMFQFDFHMWVKIVDKSERQAKTA